MLTFVKDALIVQSASDAEQSTHAESDVQASMYPHPSEIPFSFLMLVQHVLLQAAVTGAFVTSELRISSRHQIMTRTNQYIRNTSNEKADECGAECG